MRYSIDWKRYNERLSSCGRRKAMGRFPTVLLRQKATQLLLGYVCIAALQVTAEAEKITAVAA